MIDFQYRKEHHRKLAGRNSPSAELHATIVEFMVEAERLQDRIRELEAREEPHQYVRLPLGGERAVEIRIPAQMSEDEAARVRTLAQSLIEMTS